MKHLMLDIETLGDQPGSIITSIGAVQFDPITEETGAVFHEHITVQDSIDHGFKPTGGTILWWIAREAAARTYFIEGQAKSYPLIYTLTMFRSFIESIETKDEPITVWGMGARFDCGLLGAAYEMVHLRQPWEGRNEICLRTLSAMAPSIRKNTPITHVEHNALADCYHQIKYGSQLYRLLFQSLPGHAAKQVIANIMGGPSLNQKTTN